MDLRVTFLGTGDPFGTGGRLQSAVLLEYDAHRLLLDCGMTTPFALARAGIDPSTLDGIVVTHWHGDHFGGVPVLVLDLLIGNRHGAPRQTRETPLWLAGPPGTESRLRDALTLFNWDQPQPSDGDDPLAHVVTHLPLAADHPVEIGPFAVQAWPVLHTPEALGLRVTVGGRSVAYSGDTGWTDTLLLLSDGADLFICQCYTFALEHPLMLNYRRIAQERHRLRCRRLILTHIGGEMAAHLAESGEQIASDGQTLVL